jgi:class 3 adenylate cyclase
MSEVREWLNGLGLGEYAHAFERERIDLAAVCTLSDADLRELGLPMGPRNKLKAAIPALNAADRRAAARAPKSFQPAIPQDAERRQLTVMFCDLVGSTELATKLDPEQLRDLMQAYQRACGEAIARYEGHVAQYLGDGLMVYFGWPRAHEDDPARAIRAGLEVLDVLAKLRSITPIRARVGIDTGLVVVGETGQGDASIPKAAVGVTPNLAARVQARAAPNTVLVSERTRALAGGLFEFEDLGSQPLRGIAEAIRLFQVTGMRAVESRFDATRTDLQLSPFVGREDEVGMLLQRWRKAEQGAGQIMLVAGEPGVGKSRLTRVLGDLLASERHKTLRYQCSPYHIDSSLYPVIEQLERSAGVNDHANRTRCDHVKLTRGY